MGKMYAYSRTMAGAARIAAQRAAMAPKTVEAVILPFKRAAPVPDPIEASQRVKEGQHRAFAKSLKPIGHTPATQIIEQVAFWHSIGTKDILSESRSRHITAARQDAIAAVYLNCQVNGRGYGLPDLGRLFNRDHTTAHHALRKRGMA